MLICVCPIRDFLFCAGEVPRTIKKIVIPWVPVIKFFSNVERKIFLGTSNCGDSQVSYQFMGTRYFLVL